MYRLDLMPKCATTANEAVCKTGYTQVLRVHLFALVSSGTLRGAFRRMLASYRVTHRNDSHRSICWLFSLERIFGDKPSQKL